VPTPPDSPGPAVTPGRDLGPGTANPRR